MRPIDADALINEIKKETEKAIEQDDKVGSFWLGYAAGLVIKQPTIQPEKAQLSQEGTTKDTISRQWLLDCINDGWIKFDTDKDANRFIHLVRDIAPSVQPEPKNGEWLPDNNNAYEMRFVCSCCKESEVVPTIGFTKYKPLWDFCPNCGADMRGEKDG